MLGSIVGVLGGNLRFFCLLVFSRSRGGFRFVIGR